MCKGNSNKGLEWDRIKRKGHLFLFFIIALIPRRFMVQRQKKKKKKALRCKVSSSVTRVERETNGKNNNREGLWKKKKKKVRVTASMKIKWTQSRRSRRCRSSKPIGAKEGTLWVNPHMIRNESILLVCARSFSRVPSNAPWCMQIADLDLASVVPVVATPNPDILEQTPIHPRTLN